MDNIVRVAEFHEAMQIAIPKHPVFASEKETLMRLHLMTEELGEMMLALCDRNYVKLLDALCDLSYVVDGTWLSFGAGRLRRHAQEEVHRSNMTKLGADGKPLLSSAGRIIKGPNYEPAMLDYVLEQYERTWNVERPK